MKIALILLISAFLGGPTWGAAVTCRNDDSSCVIVNTTGCKLSTTKACWMRGPDGVCRKIVTSLGGTKFLPGKTTPEFYSLPNASVDPGVDYCN